MPRVAPIALAAVLAVVPAAVPAQDLVGFDRADFGSVVLSRKQAAGTSSAPTRDLDRYQNEYIRNYAEESLFARMGRAVGRLDVLTDAGVFPCTAFVVDSDHILTNHHCVPGILDNDAARATRIEAVQFVAGYTEPGVEAGARTFVTLPVPVESDPDLDYAILQVIGDPAAEFGALALSDRAPRDGDPYWVIGHPLGEAQRISREQCRANRPALSGGRLLHTCDTLPGNSGSPIIDAETQSVVGLHHAGARHDDVNFGIPMRDILARSAVLRAAAAPPAADPAPDTTPALPQATTGDALCDALYEEAKSFDACYAWQAYADACAGHPLVGLAQGYLASECVEDPEPPQPPEIAGPLRPWCTAGALNATERTICSDSYLAGLDAELDRAYATSPRQDAASQRAWLGGTRNACGADKGCIAAAVIARIAYLSAPDRPADPPPAPDRGIALPASQCYITVASRTSTDAARVFIRDNLYGFADIRMFQASNGYFAVTVATVNRSQADNRLDTWKAQGRIPGDSYCSSGDRFVREIAWAEGGGAPAASVIWVDRQADGFLNLRAGPGTNHRIVTEMIPGQQLTLLGRNGNWAQVRLDTGTTGWAYRPLLTTTRPDIRECYGQVVGLQPKTRYNTTTGAGFLSVRSAPSTRTGQRVSELYLGDRVRVMARQGDWAQVQCLSGQCTAPYRGTAKAVGWASTRYLTIRCP